MGTMSNAMYGVVPKRLACDSNVRVYIKHVPDTVFINARATITRILS